VRKLFREGANKSLIGPHELELLGGELISRSPFSESKMRLEAVERIAFDGRYTYIYVGALTAHVIPQDSVWDGDLEAFSEALQRELPVAHGMDD
jgi:hypothetical protein